jgi:hypothetical protein
MRGSSRSRSFSKFQEREEEPAMSDQLKTYAAYIVGLSILMFAWSVFKTWEPSMANQGVSVMQSTGSPARTVAPERVAAE